MPESNLSFVGHHLLNRRRFLGESCTGLAGIALAQLLDEQRLLASEQTNEDAAFLPQIDAEQPLSERQANYPAKAKRVLLIFCTGGLSQIDSWDYKPELIRLHGRPFPGNEGLVTAQGKQGNLIKSLYPFRPRGETGKQVSDLLPRLAELTDELCFVHSMTTLSNAHGPAETQMSTGFTTDGFPSMGAWCSYALGTEAADLPAFVAIPDPRGVPQVGPINWTNGFLPAAFQGMPFSSTKPVINLRRPAGHSLASDAAARDLLRQLNKRHLQRYPGDWELSARIASYELAAKMQLRVPEVSDLSSEPSSIWTMYGADHSDPTRAAFAQNCILARRLLERGVRFVQLLNGTNVLGEGVGNWDGHKTLKKHYDVHAPIFDQPAAALLTDLSRRGLLDDTLVVFTTEFGRMPTFQAGAQGRDHNPDGFTVWLAGAGVKRAHSYGASDEFGYKAVENMVTVYDFHATILHLLGLDHERLTYYHGGVQRRLTDVHGRVIQSILA